MQSSQIQLGSIDLITHAGPVALAVMAILLFASLICWTVIFSKWITLRRALSQNRSFLETFWNGKSVDEVLEKCDQFQASPVAIVFRSGARELKKLSSESLQDAGIEKVDNIHRALVRASSAEISSLERNVGWLASTASAAPFVGLFGTVWGIMNAFQNIGATGSANLAVVAPGISEALITTAFGIGAAVPAVVAYNYIVGQIKHVAVDMETFSQDFMNIVHRSVLAGKR